MKHKSSQPELYSLCWKYKWHKVKMTCHSVIEDECIWEGISIMNAWMVVSQSVIHQVLNTSNEMFNEGIILQWKRIKIASFYTTIERLDKNYCQIQGPKKKCVHLCHTRNIFLRDTKQCAWRQFCSSNTLKKNKLKVLYFPDG